MVGLSLLATACNSQNQIYSNQYLEVAVPTGWTAAQAGQNPAAVNITKNNYILYINTQAAQASGVTGGRFAEIAMGAPSADAVVTEQPSPPCGTSQSSVVTADTSRMDLFVSAQDKLAYCHVPLNGKTVWYFSYITNTVKGGYFNYYNEGQGKGYVITLAYNSKDVNSYPEKDSAGLKSMLDEMTAIVQSLEIK